MVKADQAAVAIILFIEIVMAVRAPTGDLEPPKITGTRVLAGAHPLALARLQASEAGIGRKKVPGLHRPPMRIGSSVGVSQRHKLKD